MSYWETIRKTGLRAAAVALLTTGLAFAQKPSTVGIPTAQFNFVAASQLRTEWCWAASVQMVLNWYNVPVKQADVVDRIYGNTADQAATEDAIAQALRGTDYDRKGNKLVVKAVRHRGAPPVQLLVTEMNAEHPMLITFHSTRSMLHAVVITSAEYTGTGKDTHITALTFRDPNPDFQERRTARAVRLTGVELAKFAKKISSYYLVTVKS